MTTLITPSTGTYFQNALRTDTTKTSMSSLYGTGIPYGVRVLKALTPYREPPQTGGGAGPATYIGPSQIWVGATTPLQLNAAKLITYKGQLVLPLDCHRQIIITTVSAAGAGNALNNPLPTITVTGFDDRGIAVTNTFTVNGTVFNPTNVYVATDQPAQYAIIARSTKAFSYISSIFMSGQPFATNTAGTNNFSIGVSNQFGSYAYTPGGLLLSATTTGVTGSVILPAATGPTTQAGVNFYTQSYGGGDAANAALGDARGLINYTEQPAATLNFPSLFTNVTVYGADSVFQSWLQDPTQTVFTQAAGNNPLTFTAAQAFLAQYPISAASLATNNFAFQRPNSMGKALTSFDITGVQFPGDTGSVAVAGSQANSLYQQTFPS